MGEFGLDREPVSAGRCVEIEPALAPARQRLAGGHYTPSDESGDAHKFTRALAERAAVRGVEFRLDSTVDRITASSGRIAGVMVSGPAGSQLLTADAYVVALGSYTPLLLRPLGVRLPVNHSGYVQGTARNFTVQHVTDNAPSEFTRNQKSFH